MAVHSKETSGFAKRLLPPVMIVCFFAGLALFSEDSLGLGHEVLEEVRHIIIYAIEVGLWLSAAFLLNRLLSVFFWDGLVSRALDAPVPRLLKDITGITVFAIAITAIVSLVFKQSVTGVWATSGVVGIVLGFALRPMILDVFTGLAMNVDRSFVIGDWVKIHHSDREGAIEGEVLEVNWRVTRLKKDNNSVVTLPNSLLGGMVVTNYHRPEIATRLSAQICLDFAIPTERALRIMRAGAHEALTTAGMLEDPPPEVLVLRTTELGVEYEVRFWCLMWRGIKPKAATHAIVSSIVRHLQQAGISLAYPKRDTFHARMPARHLDEGSQRDRELLLSKVELFAGLSGHELGTLAERMMRRFFRAGDIVIKEGAAGDSMFILFEGLTSVWVPDGKGGQMRVAQLGPGTFFGEMSLLTGEPRSATIKASTDSVTYEITKSAMAALLEIRPDVAATISRAVADRKLGNSKAATGSGAESSAETETLANAIMSKMRTFFRGVFAT
jgi:small-conductance mechanosensitive channel/CRP-like cAMP-binding protein